MKQDMLSDRHAMRKKLRWWRVATVLLAILSVTALFILQSDELILEDHIARLEIDGVIRDDQQLLDLIEDQRQDRFVKAVILQISSPGGTTYGGEKIYKAVKDLAAEKPVIADIRTMAASAGYMVAAGADHIVAGETSIVGSIGVIFQYPQVSEMLDKIGISVKEIKSTPLKAAPSPFQTASPEAVDMISATVTDSYHWFVDIVANSRNLDSQTALDLADGRIFTGRQALTNGLIDGIASDQNIRTYLKNQDVPEHIVIYDKARDSVSNANFLNNQFRNIILRNLGFSNISTLSPPFTELIFLDGLVSFWHVSGPNDRN